MASHRKKRGLELIKGLSAIGTALGYQVQAEYPLNRSKPKGTAVDLAWFRDLQLSPLFIFEVESKATNSASNNALKVLAKPNLEFEKPLFLFQVMMEGRNRSVIDNLSRFFGTYNYRVYSWSKYDEAKLICDVLQQHRRISTELNGIAFFEALIGPSWANLNLDSVYEKLHQLDFSVSLPSIYAALVSTDERFKSPFLASLLKPTSQIPNLSRYETYFGGEYATPIELALLKCESRISSGTFRKSILAWLKPDPNRTEVFEPYWGISRDCDEFLGGMLAGLLASITAIAGDGQWLRHLFSGKLERISDALRPESRYKLFIDVWILHLEGIVGDEGRYESARKRLNDRGGVHGRALYLPPLAIPDFETDGDRSLGDRRGTVPDQRAFGMKVLESLPTFDHQSPFSLGLALLIRQDFVSDESLGFQIISMLAHEAIG